MFRSRATRVHRQVTMPDPARRTAAERAREAAREAERRAKERAAAAAALIERDGAVGRSRLRDGGKRKARVTTHDVFDAIGFTDRVATASAQPSSDAMMPAPRRLAVEFGSGNDEREPPSSETRGGSGGGSAAAGRAAGGDKIPPSGTRRRGAAPGGLETPARATATTSADGRSVGDRFGSTWLPHGGGWRPRGRADARRGHPRRCARRARELSRRDDGRGDAGERFTGEARSPVGFGDASFRDASRRGDARASRDDVAARVASEAEKRNRLGERGGDGRRGKDEDASFGETTKAG